MPAKLKISVGTKYNRWTVVEEVDIYIDSNGKPCRKFLCECKCGSKKEVFLYSLRNNSSKSCGCFMREVNKAVGERSVTHGVTRVNREHEDSSLYFVLNSMKQRCYNENNENYKNYGLKGIVVCDEWRNSFEAFKDWAYENGYYKQSKNTPHKDKLSIDRIEATKGYYPENCRWISVSDNVKRKFNK